MQEMLTALMQEKMNPENLKKQIIRHQKPVAFMVTALIELIQYEKSLIPAHLVEPLIESTKDYVCKELDKCK